MARLITLLVFDQFGFLDVVGPADVFTIANQRAGRELYRLQTAAVSRKKTHTLLVTGAFVLAKAGLLDRRQATTHWAYATERKTRHPSIDVVADELFVRDGKFTTAAGIAAGIDLALALVAADHGQTLARQTSQRMVLYLNRSGGQSQFSERLHPQPAPIDRFEQLLADISADASGNLTNSALAERLSVSDRHLARLFRERTGTSPARWVERVRVDRVRELLENSSFPLQDIADQTGFGSVDTLRQSFHRVMGMAPSDYRSLHSTVAVSGLVS